MNKQNLFVIVHECDVPTNSPQAREIERIKKEERWMSVPNDLTLNTDEINERGVVYVCGAYSLQCVITHLTELRKARGHLKGTFLYEPAVISSIEASNYMALQ